MRCRIPYFSIIPIGSSFLFELLYNATVWLLCLMWSLYLPSEKHINGVSLIVSYLQGDIHEVNPRREILDTKKKEDEDFLCFSISLQVILVLTLILRGTNLIKFSWLLHWGRNTCSTGIFSSVVCTELLTIFWWWACCCIQCLYSHVHRVDWHTGRQLWAPIEHRHQFLRVCGRTVFLTLWLLRIG